MRAESTSWQRLQLTIPGGGVIKAVLLLGLLLGLLLLLLLLVQLAFHWLAPIRRRQWWLHQFTCRHRSRPLASTSSAIQKRILRTAVVVVVASPYSTQVILTTLTI
jgi:hypothetical protein